VESSPEVAETFISKAPQKNLKSNAAAATEFSLDSGLARDQPGAKVDAATNELMRLQRLGGYRLLSVLGVGGMGSVFLARQISLDRNVALKTIQAQWAKQPQAIARFIREAFAAAQLTHHNVTQIYDLAQDQGTNFFSMELVTGGSLDDLIKKHGRVDPQRAAALIIQAARGLQFAHDHGMVHRDIKPANLMLTKDGIVKICDLGLVKTPEYTEDPAQKSEDRNAMLASARSSVTGVGSTMGTPAYMSPEQALDSTSVDHRSDIYSLGCTFYALLTGRPPFSDGSAMEILTKLRTTPIQRADRIVKGIPAALATIVERMTEKKLDDRYQSMEDCIKDIQSFLDGSSSENKAESLLQDANQLEEQARQFSSGSVANLRRYAPLGFAGACVLLFVILLAVSFKAATAVLLFSVVTAVSANVLSAFQGTENPIGSRLRSLLLTSRWTDWLTWAGGTLLMAILIYALGFMTFWIVAAFLGVLTAGVYFFAIVKADSAHREKPLQAVNQLLKKLRLSGRDEEGLRAFVAEHSGKDWQELYEGLFGYDAMRSAREGLLKKGLLQGRNQSGKIRDALVDMLEAKVAARRSGTAEQMLETVEMQSLVAGGMSGAAARQEARERAATMLDVASQIRSVKPGESVAARRDRIRLMMAATRANTRSNRRSLTGRASQRLFEMALGGKVRFALGACMIVLCVLWMRQNNLLDAETINKAREAATQLSQAATEAVKASSDAAKGAPPADNAATEANENPAVDNAVTADLKPADADTDAEGTAVEAAAILGTTTPLDLPVIGRLFDSPAPGFIGLLILASSMLFGWKYSLFALPAAAIVLLGPSFGVPSLGFSHGASWLSAGISVAILGVGLILGRTKRPGF
jgi:serine/threonine protein kinase